MSNSYNKPPTSNVNHQQSSSILKFPGLARQSNVDEKGILLRSSSDSLARVDHRRIGNNGNNSFEKFTASCEDAWDHKIEDKISFQGIDNKGVSINTPTSRLKFGTRPAIHIKELDNKTSKNENDKLNNEASTSVEVVNSISEPLSNRSSEDPKIVKLRKLMYCDQQTDLNQLRTITWSGIPNEERPIAWKLLLGHVPALQSKREMVLQHKKAEYQNLVEQYYYNRQENDDIYRQIHIDIPRMQPLISIFQQPIVQGIFERILYIWSIRHPASGYVQGMNDLVTPFFVTYLSEFVPGHAFSDVETFDVSTLPDEVLATVESDSYWSFNKLLDSIQDNYTFAQPGIQRLVNLLSRVVSRVDKKLHEHLEHNSIEYLQFAFRWMNNLLIREIPLRCIIRLWDTYLSEGAVTATYVPSTNFSDSLELNTWSMNSGTPFSSAFHLFVCAAFLRFWSKSLLQEKDFQGLMLRLQNLPTFHWSENEVKLLVADAYQLKYAFSPNHLKV
ncbi:hypothetical protein RDWZM_009349 [Blomia tropicalis]|uniref:Rab-GAP TBC domain-containing protein n=1 Tax=Blomia tropicalis TaxID=40697 RepID=A0A9Q0M668_BLOTA|nr:hypothetical protein RDWZM_009349 [Blomia tropicalis]